MQKPALWPLLGREAERTPTTVNRSKHVRREPKPAMRATRSNREERDETPGSNIPCPADCLQCASSFVLDFMDCAIARIKP